MSILSASLQIFIDSFPCLRTPFKTKTLDEGIMHGKKVSWCELHCAGSCSWPMWGRGGEASVTAVLNLRVLLPKS